MEEKEDIVTCLYMKFWKLPLGHFKAGAILFLQMSKLRHKYAKSHAQGEILKVANSDIKNSQIF